MKWHKLVLSRQNESRQNVWNEPKPNCASNSTSLAGGEGVWQSKADKIVNNFHGQDWFQFHGQRPIFMVKTLIFVVKTYFLMFRPTNFIVRSRNILVAKFLGQSPLSSFPGSPGTRIYNSTPAQLQCSRSRAWEPGNEASHVVRARGSAYWEEAKQRTRACASKDERMADVDEGSFGSRRLISLPYTLKSS